MVKELYQLKIKEIALNITNGEVDSIRKKNVTKSGCRVYDNGCIGIAGVLGEPTEETWQKAVDALQNAVPYPYEPTRALVRKRVRGELPKESVLLSETESMLKTLKEEYPEFIFSNKVIAAEETAILKNDLGLELEDVQCMTMVSIIVKDEASANVFDTFVSWKGRMLDTEAVLQKARQILDAHKTMVELPQGELPVLITADLAGSILGDYLNIQKLKKGASLLSGKENTKVFSEDFSLCACVQEDTERYFFDAEGTTVPNDCLPLIERGVFLRGVADKKNAAEYGGELTGSASGGYDDVPTLGRSNLSVTATGTLKEILVGREAVFMAVASGGDITPAGDFATPVQTAYLCRDGKLVGRLKELNFRGNIFDLLGKGYLGCTSDSPFDTDRLIAVVGELA